MKVPAEEIQTLPLGHFYATIGNEVKKVYVLPVGVPEQVGRDVALGKRSPESVRDSFLKPKVLEVDEDLWKEKYEEEKRKREELEKEFGRQVERLSDLKAKEKIGEERQKAYHEALQKVDEIKKQWNLKEYQQTIAELKDGKATLETELKKLEPLKAFGEALARFLKEIGVMTPSALHTSNTSVGLQATATIVDVAPVEKSIVINTDTIAGKILAVAKKGKLDGWRQLGEVVKAVEEERWTVTSQQVNNALNDLVKEGLIAKRHTDRNYFCLAQGVKFKEAE
jgi:membrane-associated HD superfamily phosphohydrolase